MQKIAVIITTYNRLEKLKHTLSCYDQQDIPPNVVVVVNNNSNDGTKEWLSSWERTISSYKKKIINLEDNLGGSGGFYYGEKAGIDAGADWILVADDDAYPNKDVISGLFNFISSHNEQEFAAVCTKVCDIDGNIDLGHRRRFKYLYGISYKESDCPLTDYDKESFQLDLLTYVGALLNVRALKKIGLCKKDMFIYCDDAEHSMRLTKYGKIVCIPSLTYVHDSGQKTQNNDKNILLSWREYYGLRNATYMIKEHNKIAALFNVIHQFLRLTIKHLNSKECIKLTFSALHDGWLGKLGKHPLYTPGFSINNIKT